MRSAHAMIRNELQTTRIHPPPTPAKWVRRPRLLQRLNTGLELDRLVTLVSAPAGYGKTTTIRDWINTLNQEQIAWLSLDPSDDDPGSFLSYLLAALQCKHPQFGREILDVISSGHLPPSHALSTALINEFMRLHDRFILVLDDFHTVQDHRILEVLERILAHPLPRLHLVLITREDPPLPLAGLRAKNLLTELRAKDLRFTAQETNQFMKEVMSLSLSETDISELNRKTEGWIAGVQLAGLSIQDQTDPSRFIKELRGSHRFILSFLTEQVLDHQPVELQTFLHQTSILTKLTGDLCDAVTGRCDGHETLEQLHAANLFLIPLDENKRWYRYHHLFSDLLSDPADKSRQRISPHAHQRASDWYAQQGMVSEAVHHALAAENFNGAIELLEAHAMELIMQGYAKTVNTWVEVIPKDFPLQSPKTHLAFAWMHLLQGDYTKASTQLGVVEQHLDQPGPGQSPVEVSLRAEWFVMQSLLLNHMGKPAKSLEMASRAVDLARHDDARVHSLAHYGLAVSFWSLGEHERAAATFQKAIQYARAAANPVAEIMSICGQAVMAFEAGRLSQVFELLEPVAARMEQSGSPPPISTVIYGMLGEMHFQWYELDQARRCTLRALSLSELGGSKSGAISCHVMLSRLYQLDGHLPSAAQELHTAEDQHQADTPAYIRQEAVAQKVRLAIARGRHAAAAIALHGEGFCFEDRFTYPELPPHAAFTHSLGLLYTSSLHLILALETARGSQHRNSAALPLANDLIALAHRCGTRMIALEGTLLRAALHTTVGNRVSASKDTLTALGLAEPENIIALFLEQGDSLADRLSEMIRRNEIEPALLPFANRIMAVFSSRRTSRPATNASAQTTHISGSTHAVLVEPLSERELEVLHLMAAGHTYQSIGEALFISLNTVRFHVKALYSKLGVHNRTQAIARSRELNIH